MPADARATRLLVAAVIGRDEVIRRALQVLSRRTKNNPVLIGAVVILSPCSLPGCPGEPGVGKTAIVEVRAQWFTWLSADGCPTGNCAADRGWGSAIEPSGIGSCVCGYGRWVLRGSACWFTQCCTQRWWLEPSTGASLRNGSSRWVEAVRSGLRLVRAAAE